MFRIARKSRPSWASGFARSRSDARFPQSWDGLVGYWEPSLGPTGVTLHDTSGYGRDGTLTNMDPATDWVTDERGWALRGDDSQEHIAIPLSGMSFKDLSVLAWIKPTDYMYDRSSYNSAGGNNIRMWDGVNDGKLHFIFLINFGGTAVITDDAIASNAWTCVLATRKNGVKNLYINGQVQSSSNTDTRTLTFDNDFHIGSNSGISMTGLYGPHAIYNRAITPSEIQLLYTHPQAITQRRARYFPVGSGAVVGSPWYHNLQQQAVAGMSL